MKTDIVATDMKMCPPLPYCTNVHAGESWAEIRTALEENIPCVRACLESAPAVFPLGLRLSAQAAAELMDSPLLRDEFSCWMQDNAYEVFTINGFPYGKFHGERVKEQVFLPDWSQQERLEYTKNLFYLLDEWALPHRDISVSTVPISHKSFGRTAEEVIPLVREIGNFLVQLAAETGRDCHLGFEPEPLGFLETTQESIAFLEQVFAGQENAPELRKRLGITWDTCHLAVEYEDVAHSFTLLRQSNIRLSKIQASNALRINPQQLGALIALRQYEEPRYFHQVCVRCADNTLLRFMDLPDALAWAAQRAPLSGPPSPYWGKEWRCHFHIPLGSELAFPLLSTEQTLQETIVLYKEWVNNREKDKLGPQLSLDIPPCDFSAILPPLPHWEAETYTWDVLPDASRLPLAPQIAQELNWLYHQFMR